MKKENMREPECPTNDLKPGISNGNCLGDGHYQCRDCVHYMADFKANGQDYIDWQHQKQHGILFSVLALS